MLVLGVISKRTMQFIKTSQSFAKEIDTTLHELIIPESPSALVLLLSPRNRS
jgi:hypothetical protein